jgi:proton-translocating NAD(P)+ transhydrogenase subunit alpha
MKVGVLRETIPGERRIALVPELVPKLKAAGLEVCVQSSAGIEAGFSDKAYTDKGATVSQDVVAQTDVLLKVRGPTASETSQLREGSIVIGLLEPYSNGRQIEFLAANKITAFAMELMPRIARAQAMDAMSAMSTIAGYKAILLGANHLPKFLPLLMTAAGTIPPARVFVIGAGVAGLEAIGTAKRLGALVEAYDTRPAVKEEVESVGAKFVELDLHAADAGEKGGYAKSQSAEFYQKQQDMMSTHVAAADIVITAALVRGTRAPVLITAEMVRNMKPGSVIVDLAADQGGNCVLTKPGEEVVTNGVTVIGPVNLPSSMPFHASEMYARNITNFLMHLARDGKVQIDLNDELTRATLVTYRGEIVNEALREKQIP